MAKIKNPTLAQYGPANNTNLMTCNVVSSKLKSNANVSNTRCQVSFPPKKRKKDN